MTGWRNAKIQHNIMNINQIAVKLNKLASEKGYQISKLPELRKKYLNKLKLPADIFTYQTIFDSDDKYAFHHGGRDEMQFNFGEEYINGKKVSRYALCFSLEASRSLTNPVDDLKPFRARFDKCIRTNPTFFENFEMWYYQSGQRFGNYPPQKIPNDWFQQGSFIAIGNIIPKSLSALREADLIAILQGFDRLLPIYQYCVLQSPSIIIKEKRIAKLCWNGNDWISPDRKSVV